MSNDKEFASKEEQNVSLWMEEAKANGLIYEYTYQPAPWILIPKATMMVAKQLKTKVKMVERTIYKQHRYTADYTFKLTQLGLRAFSEVFPKTYMVESISPLFGELDTVVIDVKGSFLNRGATQELSVTQKDMWDKYKVIVEKVVPWKSQRDRKGNPKKTNKDGSFKAIPCLFMDTFCPKALLTLKNGELSAMGKDCCSVNAFIALTQSSNP